MQNLQNNYISKKFIVTIFIVAALGACLFDAKKESDEKQMIGVRDIKAPMPNDLPAGAYKLDKAHASLVFRVSHMGFSNYTARFKRFDADLQFDPKNPSQSQVIATIDPTSIETDFPDKKKLDFNAHLQGSDWLDVQQFPKIIFRSNKIELTGANTANIMGDLEMHGIKYPLTLITTFNGGYAKNEMDPGGSRIGFSAHGSLKRSDFGIKFGIPEAGSNMGVGDEVEFVIETEFNRSF